MINDNTNASKALFPFVGLYSGTGTNSVSEFSKGELIRILYQSLNNGQNTHFKHFLHLPGPGAGAGIFNVSTRCRLKKPSIFNKNPKIPAQEDSQQLMNVVFAQECVEDNVQHSIIAYAEVIEHCEQNTLTPLFIFIGWSRGAATLMRTAEKMYQIWPDIPVVIFNIEPVYGPSISGYQYRFTPNVIETTTIYASHESRAIMSAIIPIRVDENGEQCQYLESDTFLRFPGYHNTQVQYHEAEYSQKKDKHKCASPYATQLVLDMCLDLFDKYEINYDHSQLIYYRRGHATQHIRQAQDYARLRRFEALLPYNRPVDKKRGHASAHHDFFINAHHQYLFATLCPALFESVFADSPAPHPALEQAKSLLAHCPHLFFRLLKPKHNKFFSILFTIKMDATVVTKAALHLTVKSALASCIWLITQDLECHIAPLVAKHQKAKLLLEHEIIKLILFRDTLLHGKVEQLKESLKLFIQFSRCLLTVLEIIRDYCQSNIKKCLTPLSAWPEIFSKLFTKLNRHNIELPENIILMQGQIDLAIGEISQTLKVDNHQFTVLSV